MIRHIYILLLQFHPRPFREAYAEDMLWIFDQCEDKLPLVGDAVVSLVRQRLFRREPAPPSAGPVEVPMFYTCDVSGPGRASLANGGLVSMLLFAGFAALLGLRGEPGKIVIGSHHPSRSHLLAVSGATAPEALTTEVKLAPYPWEKPIPDYFNLIPILAALDTDRDGVISSVEIAAAPGILHKFDTDGDGQLSAEECGGTFSGSAEWIAHARQMFMRVHPVLAALDADHDGVISRREIHSSPAALRTLDQNGVGSLTEEELMPPPVDRVVSLLLAFDADRDGEISSREREAMAAPLKALFDKADTDRNRRVTKEEWRAMLGAN